MKQILILLSFIFCFSFMGCHEHEWESVDCVLPKVNLDFFIKANKVV